MEPMSARLTRFLIIFVVGVIVIKQASLTGFFEAKDHKGKGYYVKVPTGWKKVRKQKGMVYPEGVEAVMFVPKEVDLEFQEPAVFITIFAKKLTTPIWIEDEMPQIRQSIAQAGHRIMDKGQIKIDEVIAEWVVYHDQKKPALVLEFYLVTDNNMFYKIQYSAPPERFNVQRKAFEELRESFKFRFSLY